MREVTVDVSCGLNLFLYVRACVCLVLGLVYARQALYN